MVKIVPLDVLCAAVRSGESIYVPGSAGEPAAFLDWLLADAERSRDLHIVSTLIPGINAFDFDQLHPGARMTGLFMQPGLRIAQHSGRYRHLPLSYAQFARHLEMRVALDTTIVQVSPPDEHGRCSLGPAVEFTPLAQRKSRRTLALINHRTPPMPGAISLPLESFELAAEVDTPLKSYDIGPASATAEQIAKHIARFIDDAAALQVGLGKVPEALFALLHDRRNLRLSSGMLADSALELQASGALDPVFRHRSCVWVGSSGLYDRLAGNAVFDVKGCDETHDLRCLIALDRFTAINSALSVDLFGQANLEHAGGRAVSGVGGAADFAAAARRSRGGLSIVAMPASFGAKATSRIVARIGDGVASLPRDAIDLVVTEHGVADLRDLSVHERAEAIIAVAAPTARSELTDAWRDIRDRL